jgi:two-component system, chemotaxis family, sensor kinase CheA
MLCLYQGSVNPYILERLRGKRVLLVDDDKFNIYAMLELFEDVGADVVTAESGTEALQKLYDEGPFDIVLMDIMLPEMDGYEVMRRIRSDERFKTLPILALTAKAMKGDREKCIEAGATDYLSKPIDVDLLFAEMDRLV